MVETSHVEVHKLRKGRVNKMLSDLGPMRGYEKRQNVSSQREGRYERGSASL
jgi:hypothetical protein